MHIIYLHQYFKTPEEGGGIRSWHLSQGLAKEGIKVTLISGGKTKAVKTFGNVTVYYLPDGYSQKLGFFKRIIAFIRFVWKAYKLMLQLPKADLVYATSTPLTIAIPALLYLWKRGVPYIFEVRDLWPEIPIQLGILRNGLLKALAFSLAKKAYRKAIGIVVLSPDMKPIVKRFAKDKPIEVIPNLADHHFFQSSAHKSLAKHLVIGYFGTFGVANNVAQILPLLTEIDKLLPNQWQFIFAGEGTDKAAFIAEAKRLNLLKGIIELPLTNTQGINTYLHQCHFSYISFSRKAPLLGSGSPNKYFDSLASGTPVVLNFEGWLNKKIQINHLGFYQSASHPEECAKQMVNLFNSPARYEEVCSNCEYAALNYTPQKTVNHLLTFLKSLGIAPKSNAT